MENRAREFKVYTNSSPVEASSSFASPVSQVSDNVHPTLKFKRILTAVILLGVMAGLQFADQNLFKRKVRVVSIEEERIEPTYFQKLFCRGNQIPKFCR